MMGPISGAADSISQLKSLLELVADPKALASAIAKLEAASLENKKLIDEKTKIEASIDAKLKELDVIKGKVALRAEVLAKREEEASALQQKNAQLDAELKSKVADTNVGLDAMIKAQAEFGKAKLASELELHEKELRLKEDRAQVDAMRADVEAKVLKLKQAMG